MSSGRSKDTKVNIQKSILFLCISDEYMDAEIVIPFTIAQKIYFYVNLTIPVHNLYAENYKMLVK